MSICEFNEIYIYIIYFFIKLLICAYNKGHLWLIQVDQERQLLVNDTDLVKR